MKRSGFKAKPREGPSVPRETKPRANAEPKMKTCANRECGTKFRPVRMGQKACGTACALIVGRIVTAKKLEEQAKAERANDKVRKGKLKTRTEWEQECKAIVQKIARLRDRDDGCISCHMGPDYQGQWHGSHYRPAGNNSAVELHLWNIHKSCAQCNKFKGGNIAGYRPRLLKKIGADRVAWLESQTQVTRRTVEYLKRFKSVMGKRLRRMEKRIKA